MISINANDNDMVVETLRKTFSNSNIMSTSETVISIIGKSYTLGGRFRLSRTAESEEDLLTLVIEELTEWIIRTNKSESYIWLHSYESDEKKCIGSVRMLIISKQELKDSI
jgi:hypothetical protein